MVRHPCTGQNLLMAGVDLLKGGTDTAESQLSEAEQRIMCAKEGIGKYDMWYGVVCKVVMYMARVCTGHNSQAVFPLSKRLVKSLGDHTVKDWSSECFRGIHLNTFCKILCK
jgi:hypothetical protein